MNKIHLLDNAISNMIAAGEVVERPSSVVKELVENSIDANAKNIDIIIEQAGRSMIEIIDDGDGMEKEDALLAFKRHATSKILREKDLFRIATLGFRGEALPSISAVSKVELTTSTGGVGTYLLIENSQIVKVEASSARKGTSIKVNQLFYNTPARLKHLKSDNIEFANIYDVVCHIALGYPNKIFRLIHNGKQVFKTSGNGDILPIIATIYGIDTAKNMLEVAFQDYDFAVKGFVSKIQINRANRYSMITLLNGRYVKMNLVNNAIIEAYKTYLPNDRYPISLLNIEVDPFLVDVNVHPSKNIVRLSKENELTKLILENIKKVLNVGFMPNNIEKNETSKIEDAQTSITFETSNDFEPSLFINEKTTKSNYIALEEQPKVKQHYFNIIGQHLGTYIIAQFDDGLFIIDQHAAAERINYEKYDKLLGTIVGTIDLLVPLVIELTYKEAKLIMEKYDVLNNLGIMIELFGDNAIRISQIPTYLQNINLEVYVREIFELLNNNLQISTSDVRLHAISTIACKASIKANNYLSLMQMEHLLNELFKCENPNTCPHGRPVMLKYSNYELEKFFKRVG